MNHALVRNPYLTATASDSRAIRDLLDQQEAEYGAWRSSRKPVCHAFASAKLNSPLKTIARATTRDTAHKPLWLALLERTEKPVDRPASTASHAPDSQRRNSLSRSTLSRDSGGSRGSLASASLPRLPSLQSANNQQSEQRASSSVSFSPSVAAPTRHTEPKPARKKPSAAKRRLQKHLYDFHSSIVFTVASDTQSCIDSHDIDDVENNVDGKPSVLSKPLAPQPQRDNEPEVITIELPPPEEDPYVIAGLPQADGHIFDQIFDQDWAVSGVDRLVRDAVERKRIHGILRSWYRVLVLHFRQCAGKASVLSGSVSIASIDLFQIPSRLQFLQDLNVPCVDPPKYGINDVPLHRGGLIALLLQAAKMVAAHPSNPTRFKMFTSEGIALSEAVRCLMVEHVGVYAQVQDPIHFRELFLVDHHDRQTRRLRHTLGMHEATVSSFFFESIAAASVGREAAANDRGRGYHSTNSNSSSQRVVQASTTTMSFRAFVLALQAIHVMPTEGKQAKHQRSSVQGAEDTTGTMSAATAIVLLDESRAMGVFMQCLDVSATLHSSSGSVTSRQQLSYPQFVEALLRVILVRSETRICHGGVDVCLSSQQATTVCQCRDLALDYDLVVFDEAIDELFANIQCHRMQQVRHRSSRKMSSLRAMHHLPSVERHGTGPIQRQAVRNNALSCTATGHDQG